MKSVPCVLFTPGTFGVLFTPGTFEMSSESGEDISSICLIPTTYVLGVKSTPRVLFTPGTLEVPVPCVSFTPVTLEV